MNIKIGLIVIMISACFLGTSCRRQEGKDKTKDFETRAADINGVFVLARKEIDQLRVKVEEIFSHPEKYSKGVYPDSRYKYFDNKAYYTAADDGGCEIFVTGFVPIGPKEKQRVKLVEHLGADFKRIFQSSECISQVYISTDDSIIGIFPHLDLSVHLEPGLDIRKAWVTYWQADEKHNPQRKTLWVKPYIDALGNGYMTSVITPVYNGDILEATLGVDVTINSISKKFLNEKDRNLMILTHDQLLVAINQPCGKLLNIKSLEKYFYLKSEQVNLPVSKEYYLTNNENEQIQELSKILKSNTTSDLTISGKPYRVIKAHIPEVNWYLVELVGAQ